METSAQKFAFGIYEADAKTGELRKAGFKLKVQDQPFQVLMMLLERPGDVVSREELRLRLWPADTFVDFDHGLNTAINKLREALGDKASNPRFIETLPKRGYRFIAPVSVRAVQPLARLAQTPAPSADLDSTPATPPMVSERQPAELSTATATAQQPVSGLSPEEEIPRPSRWVPRTLFALAQFMYLVFYGAALVRIEYIPDIAQDFLGGATVALLPLIIVTATVGIALRLYLATAVTFDYRLLGAKFRKLFPILLPLDQLWALAPFLLVPQIGIGAAFAACAALLYLPFSERTLIRMSYDY